MAQIIIITGRSAISIQSPRLSDHSDSHCSQSNLNKVKSWTLSQLEGMCGTTWLQPAFSAQPALTVITE